MSQKIVFNVVKMGFNVAINGFLRLHEFSMSQKNVFLMLKKSTLLMLQKKRLFHIRKLRAFLTSQSQSQSQSLNVTKNEFFKFWEQMVFNVTKNELF